MAPLRVDSATRVANLNADMVDGKDPSQFVREGAVAVFASVQPRPEGTIRNSVGTVGPSPIPRPGSTASASPSPSS